MFTVESLAQLEAAGKGLEELVTGLADGFSYEDVSKAFQTAMQAKEVTDEIKADKVKALAVIMGAALAAFGKA
jgi:hypothetical protein